MHSEPTLTDPPSGQQHNACLYYAAIVRKALAPRWEVDTARQQTNRGDPDAGLSVEERAAKHGLGNASGLAGSFRVVGMDLDRDGRISTSTAARAGMGLSRKCRNGRSKTGLSIKLGCSPRGYCAERYEKCSESVGTSSVKTWGSSGDSPESMAIQTIRTAQA